MPKSANFEQYADRLVHKLIEQSGLEQKEIKAYNKALKDHSFMMSVFAETLIKHPGYMEGFLMKSSAPVEELTNFLLIYGLK